MPTAHLTDRALIRIAGPDAESFLQNILTTDLDALERGAAKPGALLTPQGKILFDFLISRDDAGFLLETRDDIADDFVRRLMLYRLRAKVEISAARHLTIGIRWDTYRDHPHETGFDPRGGVEDFRFFPPAFRHYDDLPAADESEADWHRFRIIMGIAESGVDYTLGDAFPHDVSLDQHGGVGFKKGCYVGQEVVSRMQHRGTARRRVLIADAETELPPSGTTITVDGRPVGVLGSVFERDGLALVRIDRVADAIRNGVPILAGGIALTLEIPEGASYKFPKIEPSSDEA